MRHYILPLYTFLALAVLPAAANPISLHPSIDTFITVNYDAGGPGSSHGSDIYLLEIGNGNAGFQAFILAEFDLSAYVHEVVTGNGTLSFTVSAVTQEPQPEPLSVDAVTSAWTNSVTWATAPTLGAQQDAQTETVSTGAVLTFTIPQATLQSWIDNPGSNDGIELVSGGPLSGFAHSDFAVNSIESPSGSGIALNFDAGTAVVPEPATLLLTGAGLIGLARARRRNS